MVNSNDVVKWGYLLDPCFQFQNTAGKPLTEGYIEVYIAGTRDKYYCASDFDGTLHPFQIPLDSLGANIVLADPEQAYDVYVYNKFGSLQMSRYNVSPGNAGGAVASNINITSSDNTINVTHSGNNYDLSIQDTIDRIDNLENLVSGVTGETDYVISTGSGDSGNFVLTNKDYKGIQYLQDMSGWRLKPGHIYQLNFNSKFTLDDNYNTLVEGKLYLDGDMSFSQDWAYTLDDSFDHIKHINGSTVIVVPNTLQYYDLKLKYTFNSVVNCQVDLENISLVDITSIVLNNGTESDYHAGDGININNSHYISVDMDYINSQIDIDSKLSSAVNIANEYTDNSIEEVIALVSGVTGELQQVNSDWNATSGVAEILNKPDLSVYATHQEVINSVSAVSSVLEQEIQDIPEQVQSDWAQTNTSAVDYIKNKPEETSVEFTGLVAGNNVTITASGDNTVISADVDLTNYATHNEVHSATSSAINSANSYTDTAIANIDLTPAVEIVSPNNSISVSSVTDSVNNTKTFYIDTNNPETNYWIGEANLSLSDQSSQGQVGYYKDVFDYTTKLNGNLDATKLKKGLYLLTANVMIVADEVNNDLAEIQIVSSSTSAISYTSSVFTHDCSVTDTLGEPMNESHQIATIVRVVYDDTPMSLIARMDDPTTITNTLKLWFSDIGLYELQGTSAGGGGSSPSASGSYEAGWGVVINGNVISVNPNIIPDVSNLASTTYVDNRIASAINIVESEIPDVSDMATETWVNNQGFLKSQVQSDWTEYNTSDPAYIKNKPNEANLVAGNNITISASGNNIVISSTASAASGITYRAGTGIDISGDVISVDNTVAMTSDLTDMATKTWVGSQGYLTSIPSNYATDTEVANAIASAVSSIPSQVQSDWTEDDTSDPSYIQNKPQTEAITVSTLVAGDNITITASGDNVVISSTGGSGSGTSYTAGTGIDITNNTISIDNTVALKTDIPDVSSYITSTQASAIVGAVSSVIENDIPDTSDMATKTWVGQQGYLTSIPSTYATDSEVSAAIATAIASVPAQVQSNWTESASASPAYIQNKPTEVSVDFCPIIAGSNITISASGDSAVISSTGGGGGSTYTAGTGIDITSNVISVDNTVALKTDIPSVTGFATEAELAAVTATIPPDMVKRIDFRTNLTLNNSTISSWVSNGYFVYLNITSYNVPANPNTLQFIYSHGGGNLVLSNISDQFVTFSGVGHNFSDNNYYNVEFNYYFTYNEWGYACNRVVQPSDISNFATQTYVNNAIAEIDIPDPVSGASGIKVEDSVVALDNPVGLVAGENITITVSGDSAIIAGQAGGGSSYTAGTGIDITNNTISVDSDYVPFLTIDNNQSTSQVTYGDLKALANGAKKFNLYYRNGYGDFYYVSRALRVGSHYELIFSTPNTNQEYDNYSDNLPKNKFRQYITAFIFEDALDSRVAYVGDGTVEHSTVNIQPNWTETNTLAESYIRNKPDLSSFVTSTTASAIAEAEIANVDVCPIIAGQNITITASGSNAVIDASFDTSTLATKAEVQAVSGAIPDTTGMVTYSGNTAINHIQLVSTLPASPDANTLYLIPEA